MNHRDRALAAMRGEAVDRIPFIARMELWYTYHKNGGTLPHPYEHAELWDMQRELGLGIFGFGAWDISFYKLAYNDVSVSKRTDHGLTVTTYETPYGVVTCRDKMSEELKEAAGTAARVEYPFKGPEDYDVLQFIFDHIEVVENFGQDGRFVDSIGGDGLALPFCSHMPAHQLMINWMGYERFYCELYENEKRLMGLVDSVTDVYRRILRLACHCPAQAIEVGANYDEQMTPPPIFDRFFAPLYREARAILEPAGKVLVVHGDGEMRKLLTSLMDCGVQVVEALTPTPMTSIELPALRKLWGDKVALWGGIASVALTSAFTDEEFEEHLASLFEAVAPGRRFILGFGDNVPTDALWPRIQRVAEFWRQHGGYPIGQAGG